MAEKWKLNKKNIFIGISIFFLLCLIIIDRILWASVSPWREDQATNLWLGYTQNLFNIPVGLISSQGIPNPNGMVILGHFLSWLPNLWFVGAFLGCLQGILVLWLCWSLFPHSKFNLLLVAGPLLTAIPLRAASVELWNQWIMTLPNILFFIWLNEYWARPRLWKIPLWISLICLAPSIYLAGVVNAVVMGSIGTIVLFFRPPLNWKTDWWKPALISLAILSATLFLTWIPYFRAVPFESFFNVKYGEPLSVIQKLRYIFESILGFPTYATFQLADVKLLFIFQYNEKTISPLANFFILISCWAYLIEALSAFCFLMLGVGSYWLKRGGISSRESNTNRDIAWPVIFSCVFIVISYSCTVFLGGPVWVRDNRTDQLIQFIPFFILFNFLAPFFFKFSPRIELIRLRIVTFLVIAYSVASLIGGFLIVESNQLYRGKILTGADAPLNQKMKVVDFIVKDWKAISDKDEIPVDYQLGGGIWDWVPMFGRQLEPWYPASMTTGRSFDYDLLRRYGLKNSQEGIQLRGFGSGRYLINYSFEAAPVVNQSYPVHYYLIGRFRITVINR